MAITAGTEGPRVGEAPDQAAAKRPRLPTDSLFRLLCIGCAAIIVIVLAAMLIRTSWSAWPVLGHGGFSFITNRVWAPTVHKFGALAFIFGTAVTALIALLLGGPIGVLIALYLSDVAPQRLRVPLGYLVDLLAMVPSVVYGLWGVVVLVPFLADHVWKPISDNLGFIPLFSNFTSGRDFATAGVILAIMIIPIVSAICREVFLTVPTDHKEAALALGATRWEMIRMAVLPRSRAGIISAVMLGFGRAVGETIAVAYLIGGAPRITSHLFQPGWTIASVIANQFNEAVSDPKFKAALIALGVVLFVMTLLINMLARLISARSMSSR
jgi:phosphate transport system permease protein